MTTVLAYFDPGSGSLLLQVLLGGAAGLLVFVKYLWGTAASRWRGDHRFPRLRNPPALAAESSGEIPIDRAL